MSKDAVGLATVALAAFAFLSFLVAGIQLRAFIRQRGWENGRALMQELRRPFFINGVLPQLYEAEQDPTQVRQHQSFGQFRLVVSRLEWVGAMVRSGTLDIRVVMSLIGAMPLRVWFVLQQFIESENRDREYAFHFQFLVRRTVLFYIEHEPRGRWPRLVCKKYGSVDLVAAAIQAGLVSDVELMLARRLRWLKCALNQRLDLCAEDWRLIGDRYA